MREPRFEPTESIGRAPRGASTLRRAAGGRDVALWRPMPTLTVLECVRDPAGTWDLPAARLAATAARFPELHFVSATSAAHASEVLPDADVVLGFCVRPDNFARATRLRWVHVTSAGVGGALFPALVDSPVVVTNARGLHATSMSEQAFGMMLALERRLHAAHAAQREHRWAQAQMTGGSPGLGQLAGRTLGLVGFGEVGRAIARLARAFGMHVLAVRRHPQQPADPAHEQWGPERLTELLARADWLALVPPLTPATERLLDAAALARLKPGARLLNLGRGGLVDEPALIEALRSGALAGAALDVFAVEPLPPDSPLWDLPEVILTPHTAGHGPDYWERAMAQFEDNLTRFLAGAPLRNVVDKRAGY